MSQPSAEPQVVGLDEAARLLEMPPDGVRGLVEAGYLASQNGSPDTFVLGDLKAFIARNADNGSGNLFLTEPSAVDPGALLEALDGKAPQMARRAFEIFTTVFPESKTWRDGEKAKFIEQARRRFEAILAITSQGVDVDTDLVGDLEGVGAGAAWSGASLPQILVVLRISRDLVVQTAVEVAEERGRHWSMALSLVLTRVLPAMDRLTDAVAEGYWQAVVQREEEDRSRYQHVVEHSSDGIYEVDLDGCVQYANPPLAVILGRRLEDIVGARLGDVFVPIGGSGSIGALTSEVPSGNRRLELTVLRRDGVRRVLEIQAMSRWWEGEVVGFQGVVRDVTGARDLEADKNEFLALMTSDLRQPLTTILGLGATLQAHGAELPADRITRMGASIRVHAERISRLADDLYDISRLEAQSLLVSPRAVDLAVTVQSALASVADPSGVEVDVPAGIDVLADPRRLEQVVANLVENALEHGAPPVVIRAHPPSDGASTVDVEVIDHGTGVPDALVPSLFNRLRLLARRERDRSRGTGLGLSLVKGLIEAMGGRVWYDRAPAGGASFHLQLPRPNLR